MAKEFDWQDYTAEYKDDDGDTHTSTVTAAVVTKDTAREVTDNLGKAVVVKDGQVVAKFGDPDRVNVFSADQWEATGYKSGKAKTLGGTK